MYNPLRIFKFAREAQASGQAVALVTIIAATGGSARRPGTLLAVSDDGRYAGSLTGGCLEAAIAAEALKTMREGRAREVRFGEGSPYIDLRLPCGGGLDLLFSPLVDSTLGARAIEILEQRKPARLTLQRAEGDPPPSFVTRAARAPQDEVILHPEERPDRAASRRMEAGDGPYNELFIEAAADAPLFESNERQTIVTCIPPLRLALFGRGEATDRLRDLALAIGAEAVVCSPDEDLLARSAQAGARSVSLIGPDRPPPLDLDRYTAAVLLFHDHDWEPAILAAALKSDAFYIGAMGSRAAHAARCEALRRLGFGEAAIVRISGPVGLIPGMRDPETLAVSALAEIVARFDAAWLGGPAG